MFLNISIYVFFVEWNGDQLDLHVLTHSFPTRRSSDLSDSELAALYRACAFTVYPSHYEGWGLPVTEALAHGQIPVIADNSSLPEAGNGFALTFRSGSVASFVEALEKMVFDRGWKAAREREIKEHGRSACWERGGQYG